MSLRITEIFASIQGESSHAGRPCSFVRLTGCNLSCKWCDTAYARQGGLETPLDEILPKVKALGIGLVEVTGGEPLLQAETPLLVKALLDEGFEVLVETNGSFYISRLDRRAKVILDVKCPSSGEAGSILRENLETLTSRDEVKFVIAQNQDFDYAASVLKDHPGVLSNCRAVHFSPVFDVCDPALLARWILDARLPVRLGLQLHKYVWDPEKRGV
ncbi:MAG: radical SAM protein [Deltaproteobacteria bacterium]|nr:radical SAM protein [Deltaproteobacteria bacterium]